MISSIFTVRVEQCNCHNLSIKHGLLNAFFFRSNEIDFENHNRLSWSGFSRHCYLKCILLSTSKWKFKTGVALWIHKSNVILYDFNVNSFFFNYYYRLWLRHDNIASVWKKCQHVSPVTTSEATVSVWIRLCTFRVCFIVF